jgi:hypothetical protein
VFQTIQAVKVPEEAGKGEWGLGGSGFTVNVPPASLVFRTSPSLPYIFPASRLHKAQPDSLVQTSLTSKSDTQNLFSSDEVIPKDLS